MTIKSDTNNAYQVRIAREAKTAKIIRVRKEFFLAIICMSAQSLTVLGKIRKCVFGADFRQTLVRTDETNAEILC